MANAAIEWASDHPVAAGAAAIGVVVVAMMLFGGSGDSGGGNAGAVNAYYAAVAQQGQAGAAVQIAQIQANASSAQALTAASYALKRDELAAGVATMQIGAQERVAYDTNMTQRFGMETQHAIADNMVALENSRLGSNERIAAIQGKNAVSIAKAGQPSGFAQGVGAVSGLVKSVGSILPFF